MGLGPGGRLQGDSHQGPGRSRQHFHGALDPCASFCLRVCPLVCPLVCPFTPTVAHHRFRHRTASATGGRWVYVVVDGSELLESDTLCAHGWAIPQWDAQCGAAHVDGRDRAGEAGIALAGRGAQHRHRRVQSGATRVCENCPNAVVTTDGQHPYSSSGGSRGETSPGDVRRTSKEPRATSRTACSQYLERAMVGRGCSRYFLETSHAIAAPSIPAARSPRRRESLDQCS